MKEEREKVLKLLEEYDRAKERYGEDSDQAFECLARLLARLPNEAKEEILREGARQGMLPKPDAYLEDGTPLYSTQTVSDFYGISQEEIQRRIDADNRAKKELGLDAFTPYDMSVIHKVQ